MKTKQSKDSSSSRTGKTRWEALGMTKKEWLKERERFVAPRGSIAELDDNGNVVRYV